MTALERFMKYVTFDTQSDEASETRPTTEKQLALGRVLMEEMRAIGLQEIRMDDCGAVFGTIPANCETDAPAVGFLAHMDTAEEASGANVCPRVVRYEGAPLELGHGVTLSREQFPFLDGLTGEELVVAGGDTLLGADDKSGVAEIMTMAERLVHTDRPHGVIRVAFTTDEEVGRGPDGFDVAAFGCKYGYTVDGGPLGEVEYDNFNAAAARISITGTGVHPGSAKNVMKNAAVIAMELHGMLPANEKPEYTEGREGFFHLLGMQGSTTGAEMRYIIRDHDRDRFEAKKALLEKICAFLNDKYGAGTVKLSCKDSYYNMLEIIERYPQLIEKANAAFEKIGVVPRSVPIRGGTDGARLSFMGLPCPNLSTGGYNFHGVQEFIPVRALEKMTDMLVELACSFAEGEA